MKIFLALKQVEFVLKLFAAAGFNSFASAFEAKDENALKAHIAQAVAAAPAKTVEKIVEKAAEVSDTQLQELLSAELREHLAGAGFVLTAAQDPFAALKDGLATHNKLVATHALLEKQLTASGIKLVAADPKVGLTAADITKAIDDRVSLKAAEMTGRIGGPPVDGKVNADPKARSAAADLAASPLDQVAASLRAKHPQLT